MVDDVIAGRYRVDEVLPDDIPDTTTSRATDTILGRSVLVRLLPAGRPALLDAARRAALVTDARLARVLDVGNLPDGRGYVINEQVSGTSLASMLQRGPLASNVARSVAGEAAAAVDVARRRGVHHLALRPSVVHVASDGRVVLTGLALDAALLDLRLADNEATRADTEDLVRLLYTALTGQWPSRPDEAITPDLPLAPTEGTRWAAPTTVAPRAGIPDDLDRLCRTLSGSGRALTTPAEVVQALEPWAQIKVQSASDMPTPGRVPNGPRPTAPAATPPASAVSSVSTSRASSGSTSPAPATGAPKRGAGQPATPVRGAARVHPGPPPAPAPVPPAPPVAAPRPAPPAPPVPAQAVGPAPAPPVPTAVPPTPAPAPPAPPVPAQAAAPVPPVPAAAPPAPASSVRQSTPGPAVPPIAPGAPAGPAPAVAAAPNEASAARPSPAPKAQPAAAQPVPAQPVPAPAVPAPAVDPTVVLPKPSPGPAQPVAQPAPAQPAPAVAPAAAQVVPEQAPVPVAAPALADEHQNMLPAKQAPPTTIAPPPGAILPSGAVQPAQPTPAEWLGQPSADPSASPGPAPSPTVPPWGHVQPDPPTAAAPSGPSWLTQFDGTPPPTQRWTGGGPPVVGPQDAPPPRATTTRTYGQPPSGQTGRYVLVGAAIIVLVVAVIGATAFFAQPGVPAATTPAQPATTTQAAVPGTPAVTGTPSPGTPSPAGNRAVIASVTTYDPSGGHEHEEAVGRLWDGDPTTSWSTFTYTQPNFGQLKDGVAIIVTLKQPSTVSSVTIRTPQTGGMVEVRATNPNDKAGGKVLASGPVSSPTTTFTLKSPQTMDSFVVWLADLPRSSGGYVLEISELEVG
ncbi:MAG: hypothetical protein FWF21_07975 [Micrococcales bacterium]|nr:hypothetical protein [Micrococcales bacterium]